MTGQEKELRQYIKGADDRAKIIATIQAFIDAERLLSDESDPDAPHKMLYDHGAYILCRVLDKILAREYVIMPEVELG